MVLQPEDGVAGGITDDSGGKWGQTDSSRKKVSFKLPQVSDCKLLSTCLVAEWQLVTQDGSTFERS